MHAYIVTMVSKTEELTQAKNTLKYIKNEIFLLIHSNLDIDTEQSYLGYQYLCKNFKTSV